MASKAAAEKSKAPAAPLKPASRPRLLRGSQALQEGAGPGRKKDGAARLAVPGKICTDQMINKCAHAATR